MKTVTRLCRWIGRALLAVLLAGVAAWTFGALHWNGHTVIAAVALAAMLAALILVRPRWRKLGAFALVFCAVLAWYFTLQPRQDRDWQPDVAQTPFAEINGDTVTLHNVRNCDYRTETDYTPRWETRTVRLSQLTGLDFFLTYWGSPHIAHPTASFQFADAPPVCFSIETRKEKGESYSTFAGFFRQFELIYVMADERDVIRLRTNFRTGEDTWLYRMKMPPEQARTLFLQYLRTASALHENPEWYNALTDNCTTGIRLHMQATGNARPWDWRLLANGHLDERAWELGALDRTLTFDELKARSHINQSARAAGDAADFSARIRAGLPGF